MIFSLNKQVKSSILFFESHITKIIVILDFYFWVNNEVMNLETVIMIIKCKIMK